MHSVFTSEVIRALRGNRRAVIEPGADGRFIFAFSRVYQVAAALSAGLVSGLAFATWVLFRSTPVPQFAAVLVFASLSMAFLWATWDAFFVRLSADSIGVRRSSLFGSTEVAWLQVTSISYEPLLSLFTIRASHTSIRFTAYRHGLSSLSSLAWQNLPEAHRGMASVIGLEAERNTAA